MISALRPPRRTMIMLLLPTIFGINDVRWLSANELPTGLKQLWDQQRTSVNTARIQFHRLQAGSGFTNLDPTRFIELCRNFQLGSDPHKTFRDTIVPAVFTDQRDRDYKWLRPARFLLSGTLSRCDEWHGSLVITQSSEVLVDGENQINIYLPGGCHRPRTTLDSFRILPSSTHNWNVSSESAANSLRQMASADESFHASVDSSTGDFLEFFKEHDGNIESAVFQWNPVDYSNGLRFPNCVIGATFYPNGTLRSLSAVFIDQAEFDQPISEKEFLVPVKRGTTVVDYRAGGPSPYAFSAPADLPDVRFASRDYDSGGLLDADETTRPTSSKPPTDSRGWLLTLVAIVIFIAVVGSHWFRTRRQSSGK